MPTGFPAFVPGRELCATRDKLAVVWRRAASRRPNDAATPPHSSAQMRDFLPFLFSLGDEETQSHPPTDGGVRVKAAAQNNHGKAQKLLRSARANALTRNYQLGDHQSNAGYINYALGCFLSLPTLRGKGANFRTYTNYVHCIHVLYNVRHVKEKAQNM
jgi:hypothetical protein